MEEIIKTLDQDVAINQDILDSHAVCPRDYHEGVIAGLGKALSLLRSNKHTLDSIDGGCQMPKTAIVGYCSVCGCPNRTCQSEKQRTQKSDYEQKDEQGRPLTYWGGLKDK